MSEEKEKTLVEEKIRILYVDDEINNLTAFKANFRRHYEVHTAESATEAKKILETITFHVIVTDQRMPGITGVQFLEQIIPLYPDPVRILLTGFSDIEAVIDAINRGHVFRYCTKPWNEHELKMTIDNAIEIFSLKKQNKELIEKLLMANEQLEFYLRQKMIF